MKVVDREVLINNQVDTKTVQNFGAVLGTKPEYLGQVADMYKSHSISWLTDALRNVWYNETKKGDSMQPVNGMVVEWTINTNYIKKVKIAETNSTANLGKGFAPFKLVLEEKYYDKNDTFHLENRQQVLVVKPPRKKGARRWEYTVIILGNNAEASIDTRYTVKGKWTKLRSNYYPEISKRGYVKYTSNTEKHRNYLSRHRSSDSQSTEFAATRTNYYEKKGKDGIEYFKMNGMEEACLESFMAAKENNIMWSECNFDSEGHCMHQDDDGQDIPMGDGVERQVEKVCDIIAFSKFNMNILTKALNTMREKSDKDTGNSYVVTCNSRLYEMFGEAMKDDYRFNSPNDATFFYSKEAGRKIKVGAEWNSYTFQGNTITFMVNKALTEEYPDNAYGLFLDVGQDLKSGKPNVMGVTLKGSSLISGTLNGMGGQNGTTSGVISSSTTASEYHLYGTSGAVVYVPYRSFIIKEERI